MTNPLRIGYANHGDSSTVNTSAVSSLPASNMLDADIQKIWRATSSTGSAIRIELSGQKEIGAIVFVNVNLTNGTHRVRVSTSDPDGIVDNVHDSGELALDVDPTFRQYIYLIEPAVIGKYLRISTTITNGPMEAGRLVVAPLWSPSRGISLVRPPERIDRDHTITSFSIGQNRYDDIRPRQRGWRFTLKGITDAEKITYVDRINRTRGVGREILVCFDKDSDNLGRDTIWGHLAAPLQPRHMAGIPGFWECEFEIMERI